MARQSRRRLVLGLAVFFVAMLPAPPAVAQGLASTPPASSSDVQDQFWSRFKNVKAGPLVLDFGGQSRLRFEYDDEFALKGYAPGHDDQLLLERVRLDLSARYGDDLRLFLQLQDAHAFLTQFGPADFSTSSPIDDTLDIRQLYAESLKIHGSPFGFRIGRQQISYDDQRVFGPGNWGNTGRFAWDAAMLKIDTTRAETDVWLGKYLTYQTHAWPNRPVGDFLTLVTYSRIKKLPFRLDVFYVLKDDDSGKVAGESGTGNLLSHTVGFQAEGRAFHLFDAAATFAAQFGKYGRDRLRAAGGSGSLGVTAPTPWKPRLRAQLTWGSGDADPNDGNHGTFDGVYGGRDIYFYGYLNLFFWANLWDAELDFSVQPSSRATAYIEYHHFRLAEPRDAWYSTGLQAVRRDPTGRSGTDLGGELDFRVVWALSKHIELMGGCGRFMAGSYVKSTGPSAPATWFFSQAVYSW
jgi:hypothetical protein